MKIIARFNLPFDANHRTVAIAMPVDSELVACRLEPAGQSEFDELLSLYAIMTEPVDGGTVETHQRKFHLLFAGEPLPDPYVKYIGTFKFKTGANIVHVVEV